MKYQIASINLNWGRKARTQHGEVRDLLDNGACVVGAQEVRFGRLWNRLGWSEAIFTKGVEVVRKGFRLGATSLRGQEIRYRRHRWMVIRFPGIGRVRVIDVHMPPHRMQDSGLYEDYTKSLHKVISRARKRGEMFLVMGDFNKTRQEDPAGLGKTFGAEWRGAHIDLFAIDPRLMPFVHGVKVGPKRWDGHQIIYLTLEGD